MWEDGINWWGIIKYWRRKKTFSCVVKYDFKYSLTTEKVNIIAKHIKVQAYDKQEICPQALTNDLWWNGLFNLIDYFWHFPDNRWISWIMQSKLKICKFTEEILEILYLLRFFKRRTLFFGRFLLTVQLFETWRMKCSYHIKAKQELLWLMSNRLLTISITQWRSYVKREAILNW